MQLYLFPFFLFSIFCFFFISFKFELTVVASDSLNEREATVVVFVRDVNDMPPEFEKNLYVTSIIEESPMNEAPLLQVNVGRSVSCQVLFP
jgi:hypothetical protein